MMERPIDISIADLEKEYLDFPNQAIHEPPMASRRLTKLWNWEFWPWHLVYIPVYFKSLVWALKAGHPTYFALSNPGFKYGGMFGEEKWNIYSRLPKNLYPKSFLWNNLKGERDFRMWFTRNQMEFPLIAKPNRGERGNGVRILHNWDDVLAYRKQAAFEVIVQEFVDDPWEIGIFYYRMPEESKGRISSVVVKHFTVLKGDGERTVAKLIQDHPRLRFFEKELFKQHKNHWFDVPEKGQDYSLVRLGNHSKGVIFLDGKNMINDRLIERIDTLSQGIDGFYYGRYDIKCRSLEDLYAGRFCIIELNGAMSEPGHIYHPCASLKDGLYSLLHHHKVIYKIAKQNRAAGFKYPNAWRGVKDFRSYLKYNRYLQEWQKKTG
jgi:hypothetical protein